MKFISQIFKDVNDSYSSKRTAFFIFIFLFVAIHGVILFRLIPSETLTFLQSSLEKVTDVIKWLGGFIVAEQATKFASQAPK